MLDFHIEDGSAAEDAAARSDWSVVMVTKQEPVWLAVTFCLLIGWRFLAACELVSQSDAPGRKKRYKRFGSARSVTKNKRDEMILSDAAEPMLCSQHRDPGNRK